MKVSTELYDRAYHWPRAGRTGARSDQPFATQAGEEAPHLMGQLWDRRQLRVAYAAVHANRGAPGVDGGTVETFGEHLEANVAALIAELRAKTSRPLPVRRVWIPKPDGRQQPLVIPEVWDRVVPQATQVLEPVFAVAFSPHCHGFRTGRGPIYF